MTSTAELLTLRPALPPGREVVLPGRGSTFVREVAGPPGAPTVVLLHGLGATADLNWFQAFPALQEHFHVVAPDLRGHGRGPRSASPFTLEDAADDIAALVDVMGIESFIAIGYSMGGAIAQLIWRRNRARLSGLVLCATSRSFRATLQEQLLFTALPSLHEASRAVPDALIRRIIHRVISRVADPQRVELAREELARFDIRAVLEASSCLGAYSSHAWMHHVDVPTAVLIHTRDQLVPPSRQHGLAGAIPGAALHFVDGDHFAIVRDPERAIPVLVAAARDIARLSAAEPTPDDPLAAIAC